MKLSKTGGIVLVAGIIATVLWVSASPETCVGQFGNRACSRPEMFIRFLVGGVAAIGLAFAASAVWKDDAPATSEDQPTD